MRRSMMMGSVTTDVEIVLRMQQEGFPTAIVPLERMPELRSDYTRSIGGGSVDLEFYDQIVSRYELAWEFDPFLTGCSIRSIVVAAAPHPKVRITFRHGGSSIGVILPPTYRHDTDIELFDRLSKYLEPLGFRVCRAVLPEKLLAVRSSLARYGRNNIAYIDGLGSYFRPNAFFSDLPCETDAWQEAQEMDRCEECNACVHSCPTGAIDANRFIIHAERCLTFFNEGKEPFPDWIDSSSHNSLIGCMVCQDVCPADKPYKDWIVEGAQFSEAETNIILQGVPKDHIPALTAKKLESLWLLDDYDLLSRNLSSLIFR